MSGCRTYGSLVIWERFELPSNHMNGFFHGLAHSCDNQIGCRRSCDFDCLTPKSACTDGLRCLRCISTLPKMHLALGRIWGDMERRFLAQRKRMEQVLG
eukprot:s789_g4.t1